MLRNLASVDAGERRKGLNPPRFSVGGAEEGLLAFAYAFWRHGQWRAVRAGLLVAGGALLDGVGLLMLVPVLDLAMGSGGRQRHWALLDRLGAPGSATRLLALLALFVAVMALRALVLTLRDRALAQLQIGFVEAIRARLVDRLASAPWSRVSALSHASVVQALSVEVPQVGAAAHALVMASVSAVLLLGHGVLAMVLAPLAGGVALVCAGFGFLISRRGFRGIRQLGQSVTRAHFGMTEHALHFLSGLKVAAAQGLSGDVAQEHHAIAGRAARDREDFMRLQSRLREGASALAALAGAGLLFAGIALFHLAVPVLVTLLLVLSRMLGPVQAVQQAMQQIAHTLPAYAQIRALERALAAGEDHAAPPPTAVRHGGIQLAGVTLAHGGQAPLLNNLDLTLPRGSFIGIVGPSGCGKTSLLDAIAGLLPPQTGQVHVLGRALSDEGALVAHRRALAYVGQEPFLLDGSVRRNLAWSCPDADETAMWAALEQAEAAQIVRRLEGGLEARIGARGSLLSAGERQRLALARALLRAPDLLLLDEATNAVDVACEERILRRLAALSPRVTILLVAHRRESLRFCHSLLRFPGPVLVPSEGDGDAADQLGAVERAVLVKPQQI